MGKGYPISRATKAFNAICEEEPEYMADVAELGTVGFRDEIVREFTADLMDDMAEIGVSDPAKLGPAIYLAASRFPDQFAPNDLVWASRWRTCRQVYRLDRAVADEMPETDIDDEIPTEIFERLPYPIVYVSIKFTMVLTGGELFRGDGYLAHIEDSPHPDSDCRLLAIDAISESGGRVFFAVPIKRGVTVRSLIRGVTVLPGSVTPAENPSDDEVEETDGFDEMKAALSTILNSLMYVISEEEDVEVVYAPANGGRGYGRKRNGETVRTVGAKIGRALGAQRRRFVSGAPSKAEASRTVRPHVRCAHWQHFWTGKRKGRDDGRFGDELILKWVPPTHVNGDGEPDEIVHQG